MTTILNCDLHKYESVIMMIEMLLLIFDRLKTSSDVLFRFILFTISSIYHVLLFSVKIRTNEKSIYYFNLFDRDGNCNLTSICIVNDNQVTYFSHLDFFWILNWYFFFQFFWFVFHFAAEESCWNFEILRKRAREEKI